MSREPKFQAVIATEFTPASPQVAELVLPEGTRTTTELIAFRSKVLSSTNSAIGESLVILIPKSGRLRSDPKFDPTKKYLIGGVVESAGRLTDPMALYRIAVDQPSMACLYALEVNQDRLHSGSAQEAVFRCLVTELSRTSKANCAVLFDALGPPPDLDMETATLSKPRSFSALSHAMAESARSAPDVGKLALWAKLVSWEVEGSQDEFLKALIPFTSEEDLSWILRLDEIDVDFNRSRTQRPGMFRPDSNRLLSLAENANSDEVKGLCVRTLRSTSDPVQLRRLAQLLNRSDTRLQALVVNRLAEFCREPSKRVNRELFPDDTERMTKLAEARSYWRNRFSVG